MTRRHLARAGLLAAGMMLFAVTGNAATFRYANDGDANSMDPYVRSETFLLTFTQNFYDPLVRRDRNLKLEPALAESWEQPDSTTYRFHLRKGVKFQEGQPFTADDVVFSHKRATGPGSQINAYFQSVKDVQKVDDNTVDFHLKYPNPIMIDEITNWVIMSKQWCEEHNATEPVDLTKPGENYATRHANGTGPFILQIREPDRRTTLKNNPDWWDKPEHNLTEVQFNVISNAATRVAALLSGDVDMIYTVPPQDMDRLGRTQGIKLLVGPELRTIFLGFDASRPELLKSDVKGKNPFQDRRVRQAFYQAIDINAIKVRVMRNQSRPTGLMYGPGVNGWTEETDKRLPYDPEASKKLLAEAGYPNGFGVTLDCPNDRYVNDEAICQAVTAMLARIGVKVNLLAQPKAKYFAKILVSGGYDSSFYLLGWTPGSFDSWNVLANMYRCRDEKGGGGNNNVGNYCNPKMEDMIKQILVEADTGKRDQLIKAAYQLGQEQDWGYVPLHQQALAWGASKKMKIVQRADNQILFYWFRKE